VTEQHAVKLHYSYAKIVFVFPWGLPKAFCVNFNNVHLALDIPPR